MEIRSVARYIGTDVQLVCVSFDTIKMQQSDGNVMHPFTRIKSVTFETFYPPWSILVKVASSTLKYKYMDNINIVKPDFPPPQCRDYLSYLITYI